MTSQTQLCFFKIMAPDITNTARDQYYWSFASDVIRQGQTVWTIEHSDFGFCSVANRVSYKYRLQCILNNCHVGKGEKNKTKKGNQLFIWAGLQVVQQFPWIMLFWTFAHSRDKTECIKKNPFTKWTSVCKLCWIFNQTKTILLCVHSNYYVYVSVMK